MSQTGGVNQGNGLDLNRVFQPLAGALGLNGADLQGLSIKELLEKLVPALQALQNGQGAQQPQGQGGGGPQAAQGGGGQDQLTPMNELERDQERRAQIDAQNQAAMSQLEAVNQIAKALMNALSGNPEAKAQVAGILNAAGVTIPGLNLDVGGAGSGFGSFT